MVIAFLRGKNKLFSTSEQQSFIIAYANENAIAIEMTEIDNDLSSQRLENRQDLLKTLHSMTAGDTILIYDLWVFSQKVGELAKVFDCILRHEIIVHICKQELIINNDIPLGVMVNLLSEQRERNLISQKKQMGRPKGSISKSKFDKYKSQIVTMIQEDLTVSEIAKRLEVSRSSLKDYINSRSLKEIALSKVHQRHTKTQSQVFVLPDPNECPLIDKKV
ncbi:MAG: recombinase family protein [Epsilonproteobacteria bacterium]|nr:recombinase family protein [Campylobacterota bacterium]